MLTAALVSSLGALTVALIDNRVPVFEIVVHLPSLSSPSCIAMHAERENSPARMQGPCTDAHCVHAQLIRSGLSFALSAAAAAAQKLPNLMGTRALWPLLGVRGFVGAASMTLYYEAINRLPLADVVGLTS